jgi:hypothetical protein
MLARSDLPELVKPPSVLFPDAPPIFIRVVLPGIENSVGFNDEGKRGGSVAPWRIVESSWGRLLGNEDDKLDVIDEIRRLISASWMALSRLSIASLCLKDANAL